jgi:hypothetical protein
LSSLAFLTLSCESDEGLEIKAIRDFDIYADDTLNNVFTFDMVPTSNGYLIAAVCGNSQLSNKFDGNGRLSLIEVDLNGDVLWEEVCGDQLFESGYPSNLISTQTPDQFYLFWNEFNGNLKVLPIRVGLRPDSLEVIQMNCNGCRVDKGVFVNDKVYTLGLAEKNNEPTTIISEFDINLASVRPLSEKPFNASRLGGFGLNDLTFVNRVNNFIHIEPNRQRLLFSGPAEDIMALAHVGELTHEFEHGNMWIADIFPNPDLVENFALILLDPSSSNGQTIFIPEVDFSGLPGDSDLNNLVNKRSIIFSSLDSDLPQFIIYYSPNRWVVVGTSLNGIPTILSINVETNEVVRSDIGNSSRMNITKAEMKMGTLYISGTTVINNRFQRPLLLKIAKEDIF